MLVKEYTLPILLSDKSFEGIYIVQQSEIDEYNFSIDDIVNQCFIDKATWGLGYWEDIIGIDKDAGKSLEQRREIIKSALVGHGTVTVNLLKDTAKAFTNGEVELTENIEPYTFEIKFVGTRGIPVGLVELKRRIDIIKPAHLLVKYKFIYNTHNDMKNRTHDFLKTMTHEEIKLFQ